MNSNDDNYYSFNNNDEARDNFIGMLRDINVRNSMSFYNKDNNY